MSDDYFFPVDIHLFLRSGCLLITASQIITDSQSFSQDNNNLEMVQCMLEIAFKRPIFLKNS